MSNFVANCNFIVLNYLFYGHLGLYNKSPQYFGREEDCQSSFRASGGGDKVLRGSSSGSCNCLVYRCRRRLQSNAKEIGKANATSSHSWLLGPSGTHFLHVYNHQHYWLLICNIKINLIVGDYLKQDSGIITSADKALSIIKWFNNHSVALGLLRKCQKESGLRHELALILPSMRWTANYLAFSRLLETAKAIRVCAIQCEADLISCAGPKKEKKSEASEILTILNDPTFWESIATWVDTAINYPGSS